MTLSLDRRTTEAIIWSERKLLIPHFLHTMEWAPAARWKGFCGEHAIFGYLWLSWILSTTLM
jgi:hypothetical protein